MKLIPLSGERGRGMFATVDDADAELVSGYTWWLADNGTGTLYVQGHIPGSGHNGRKIRMHQLITGWRRTDHWDGDPLNNTRHNLREATAGQNMANSGSQGGRSRFKGVSWERRRGKWVAEITVDKRRRYLGQFDDEDEAARAYDAAALAAWGGYARRNLPVSPASRS